MTRASASRRRQKGRPRKRATMAPARSEKCQPSRSEQDYLKALHRLGGADGQVSPVSIAGFLRVRPPSVTGMLKRLSEAGWIDYDSGVGAQLSPTGLIKARQVVRRHRLIELFLARVLGLDWSEVDAEADALEHAVSPWLEQRMAAFLGEPLEDPHGHPIPTVEGDLQDRQLQPLGAFRTGQQIVVREAADDDPDRLRHWQALGLLPGATVHILSHQPLDDVFQIQVGSTVVPIGSEGLAGLYGEEAEPIEKRHAA